MRTSQTEPIRVDFVASEALGLPGELGLTMAPGQRDAAAGWQRDLTEDLQRLRFIYRVDRLVTLLDRGDSSVDEFALLGIPDLSLRVQQHGMMSDWFPIRDGGAPVMLEKLLTLVTSLVASMRDGKTVVIHCRAGFGRSGTVAAACLIVLGASAKEAMATARRTRPGTIETVEQERCLHSFDDLWRDRVTRGSQRGVIAAPDAGPSRPSSPPRISSPGIAPISHVGAATVTYLGLDPTAEAASVPDASPLRPGDDFHIMPGTRLCIGRASECEVYIRSSQLSRVHTVVAFSRAFSGQIAVADLGSRNGTWFGATPIQVCMLSTGDEFSLARAYRFRFESVG